MIRIFSDKEIPGEPAWPGPLATISSCETSKSFSSGCHLPSMVCVAFQSNGGAADIGIQTLRSDLAVTSILRQQQKGMCERPHIQKLYCLTSRLPWHHAERSYGRNRFDDHVRQSFASAAPQNKWGPVTRPPSATP